MYFKNRSVSVFFVRVFLLLVAFCFEGQAALSEDVEVKKAYNSKLDSLWSRNIYIHSLSGDGNWVALRETYATREETILILNTQDSTKLMFREGRFLAFSSNNNWIGLVSPENELELCNLKNHTRRYWFGISSFRFSPTGDHFAAERIGHYQDNSLLVVNLKNPAIIDIRGISEYLWHPGTDVIAACLNDSTGSQVILYDASTDRQQVILTGEECIFSRLLWSGSGNALVFLKEDSAQKVIYHYKIADSGLKKIFVNNDSLLTGSKGRIRELRVSDDGSAVLYSLGDNNFSNGIESLQIWDAEVPWIYPRTRSFSEHERSLKVIFWDTRSGQTFDVTDEKTPDAKCNPDYPVALVYDKMIYEPQYKQETDVDLYFKNLRTGEKSLIVSKQYTYSGFIKLSPTQRYVAFFRDHNWLVYDSESKKTINLTANLGLHFEKTEDAPEYDKEPYGNPGWTVNDEYIILYDRYDIWLMTPDGNSRKRITRGREQQIRYRICNEVLRNDQSLINSSSGWKSTSYDLTHKTLFKMDGDDFQTGYAILDENREVETILYGPGAVEGTLSTEDKNHIIFKSCRFNQPPAIYLLDLQTKKKILLYQGNLGLLDYDLGSDELLRYDSGDQNLLSGALIYPANFDQTKKYPMVVFIYEKNSGLVNTFSPPSDYEYIGFNILRYVTNGYFVLLPDIQYNIGEPGISALISVTGLVEKVLNKEYIDETRIGLIGHSFGGYEASFIATQTNMFRAVVAGSAITDLVSWYHDIQGNGWDTEQMWRLENHQLRMGGSYYDHKKQYQKNSPLHNVENLNTPLLLWVGKNDYNVNWYQSIYMFMAMKRLGKKGKLLLFNDEGHYLAKPENQKMLSDEVFTWLNSYLMEGRSESSPLPH
jgi:dipeptidyl aminopeptidase/acylaminoacyl peptidase